MALFCIVLGMSPSEYKKLSYIEHEALVKQYEEVKK